MNINIEIELNKIEPESLLVDVFKILKRLRHLLNVDERITLDLLNLEISDLKLRKDTN